MGEVKAYLLSVTAAAILCGCMNSLIGKKNITSSQIRLLCGIFLSLAVLKPLVEVGIPDISYWLSDLETLEVAAVVEDGTQKANASRMEIIKTQAEEYILDKASSLSCDLEVTVVLSDNEPYEPVGVTISGEVSPYAKVQLSGWICDTFSISEEEQIWIG